VHGTGALSFGGPIATAGGLVFIAATNDHFFHAFDANNLQNGPVWSFQIGTSEDFATSVCLAAQGKQHHKANDQQPHRQQAEPFLAGVKLHT